MAREHEVAHLAPWRRRRADRAMLRACDRRARRGAPDGAALDRLRRERELADLLDGYEEQILLMTDEAHEDIFLYGPHFVEQLRKKAEIMWDHMLDGNRVYVTHNI